MSHEIFNGASLLTDEQRRERVDFIIAKFRELTAQLEAYTEELLGHAKSTSEYAAKVLSGLDTSADDYIDGRDERRAKEAELGADSRGVWGRNK